MRCATSRLTWWVNWPSARAEQVIVCSDATPKVQKAVPQELFNALVPAMCRLQDPAIQATQDLTRNNLENTKRALRMGYKAENLAEDSNVGLNEEGQVHD